MPFKLLKFSTRFGPKMCVWEILVPSPPLSNTISSVPQPDVDLLVFEGFDQIRRKRMSHLHDSLDVAMSLGVVDRPQLRCAFPVLRV